MGIQGLLPNLKSIHEHRKISEFAGQTLAVDGYVWLHRGAYGCATQLVKGESTTRYVDYAMHRVRLLKHHNITPYVVFDGGPLPAKKGTESSRFKSREENRIKGFELSAAGKHSEARECFTKAVDVTPELAYQFIKALKAEDVSYVVAPYEADAQLAFLERTGIVDGIITEDSDLLVFGCKNVLFKLDSDGNCVLVRRERFANVAEMALHGWSDKQFREMAMLSGCDYIPSIPGLGIKTSHKLLRKHKTVEGVLRAVRLASQLKIPHGYLQDFRKAELAFMYQRVYDPRARCLTTLSPIPDDEIGWDDKFVGEDMDSETAIGVADGSIHPCTLVPMLDINPNFRPSARGQLSFEPREKIMNVTPVHSKGSQNTLMKYFSSTPLIRKLKSESVLHFQTVPTAKENALLERISARGRASGSGRSTLTMEHDSTQQRLSVNDPAKGSIVTSSRFFGGTKRTNDATESGPDDFKLASPSLEPEEGFVAQEIGYRSPSLTFSELVDVSSPPTSREVTPEAVLELSDIEHVSSPVLSRSDRRFSMETLRANDSPHGSQPLFRPVTPLLPSLAQVSNGNESRSMTSTAPGSPKSTPRVFVHDTPTKPERVQMLNVDLADVFAPASPDKSSVIGDFDDLPLRSPSAGPNQSRYILVSDSESEDHNAALSDSEQGIDLRQADFQTKWRESWSHRGSAKRKATDLLEAHDVPSKKLASGTVARHAAPDPSPITRRPADRGRRSLPNLPVAQGQRKPLPRRNATLLPRANQTLSADWDEFRHKPLRLR